MGGTLGGRTVDIDTIIIAVGMSVEEDVGGYFYVRGFEARVGGCIDVLRMGTWKRGSGTWKF